MTGVPEQGRWRSSRPFWGACPIPWGNARVIRWLDVVTDRVPDAWSASPLRQTSSMALRSEVESLVALGPMPSDAEDPDEGRIGAYVRALDALPGPLTDEEATALLGLFPLDDSSMYEVAWTLVHAVESAPGWPIAGILNGSSWWVSLLRGRCERAGPL